MNCLLLVKLCIAILNSVKAAALSFSAGGHTEAIGGLDVSINHLESLVNHPPANSILSRVNTIDVKF